MEIYARGAEVWQKADQSPVTEADLAVDAIVVPALETAFADIPVISEERAEPAAPIAAKRFFLVDPIDGTKEFIKRTGEFTINIALIEDGTPIAGIVYAPALGRLFLAEVGGKAIELCEADTTSELSVRDCTDTDLVALASRSHNTPETQKFLDDNAITECVSAGSSLKFCTLATGDADIYPRFGPTMEWDTAAGHAVLAAAGGAVQTTDNRPLTYGKPGYKNPHFIASSPTARARCSALN